MEERVLEGDGHWQARPFVAESIRIVALLLPIGASVSVVYLASRLVHPPVGSLALYLGWWVALSLTATAVLAIVGRLSRRMLPLAALLRLSLIFPDGAPSRFRTAIQSCTVKTLEERLLEAKRHDPGVTPAQAAQRLLSLVAALDTHDNLTRGHSERVRAYAQMIGRELGLKPREVELLNWAALLHDVGKLEVPREILTKKGRPTDEEWATIRRHPELGEALVAPLRGWLGEWCDAVGYHHERWDGAGYPRAIAGRAIPLAGRIVAVADVFDVITSSRSYKEASAASAGRAEIARCAGGQFDPEIVRSFLAISLGRPRVATGAFAWLAQAAVLARVPLASAAGTASAAVIAISAPVSSGIVAQQGEQLTRASTATTSQTAPAVRDGSGPAATLRPGVGSSDKHTRTIARPTVDRPIRRQPARPRVRAPEPREPSVPDPTPSSPPLPPDPTPPAPAPPEPAPPEPAPPEPAPPPANPRPPATPTPPAPPTPPLLPSIPQLPTPTLPALPQLPSPPTLPTVPQLPTAPTLPSLPSLPAALPLPTTPPTLPSIPSTPAGAAPLPQLPSIPSLPPLPGL